MRLTAGVALMVLALIVAACADGGGEEEDPESAPESPPTSDAQLTEMAAEAVAAHGVPAAAIARVALDGGVLVGVAGNRSHDDTTPVPSDSPFHLGSDTKAMTAVLVGQLAEAGLLDLDARVSDLIADAEPAPNREGVTVREVLGHRSGLVDELDLIALHGADDPVGARRAVVRETLAREGAGPGAFAYANVNYMVAGAVVEEVTGQPWNDVMRRRLFEPLGMTSCGFGAPMGDLDPLGHTPDGAPVAQDAAVTDNPPALGPAGTVHCSVGDWAKFAAALLAALTGADTEIISARGASDLFAGSDGYVAGWVKFEVGDEVTYGHDGSNTLWYARAVLRPARRDAVLIAVNTGEAAGVDAVEQLTASLLDI